ncbi:hypothetical protein [Chryseobacterium rhizoplanae]|nr:hypothetical protein [Chryseobacterium rhizoplanae]
MTDIKNQFPQLFLRLALAVTCFLQWQTDLDFGAKKIRHGETWRVLKNIQDS